MSRIAALTDDQVPAAAEPLLKAVKAKMGKVPNAIRTLANSPAVLGGYLQLSGALAGGTLSAAQRESIALATGQSNECSYCLSAHTLAGKGAGLSNEQIQDARQGINNPVASLAKQLVAKHGLISDSDLAQARANGLTEAQIVEVIGGVALNTLTNYLNHAAATEIDFPVVAV
ncbi:carboxymuconolactone decarboxylase family protein [Chitinimonas sp.]|uniref:carboxymuconolactone decarboxylase family protein n=1 Tax=Chitinimonas sp. TaxID=1934313 RepID=UPI002F9340A3